MKKSLAQTTNTLSYTRYIILSYPRAGSNYLVHLLQSHPQIVSFGEPFNLMRLYGNPSPHFMDTSLGKILFRFTCWWDPLLGISLFVFHPYAHYIRAVGWKLFYHHGLGKKSRRLREYLRSHKDIHVIHLTRTNFLASLVSLRIAQQTGKYIQLKPALPQKNVRPISLTTEECEEYFLQIKNNQSFYRNYFRGHPWLGISYEELWKHEVRTLAKIQSFLHVKPLRSLSTNTHKQNKKPLRSLVSNYDDLKKHFKNTQWEKYFS